MRYCDPLFRLFAVAMRDVVCAAAEPMIVQLFDFRFIG